jgi:ethanolamine-phosphate cytidylyltransferase
VLTKVYNIHIVVHGTTEITADVNGQDPYALPKQLGIYQEIETPLSAMTNEVIINRIVANRQVYEARNKRKQEKAALEEKLLAEERQKNSARS